MATTSPLCTSVSKESSTSDRHLEDVEKFRGNANDIKSTKSEATGRIIDCLLDSSEHNKSLSWGGWGSIYSFGLEIQRPWSDSLLEGSKAIETRNYDLPKALIGKRIQILETKPGEDGVSDLGDYISGLDMEANESLNVVGWVVFGRVIEYRDGTNFEADEKKHLVKKGSAYGWNLKKKIIYGWFVSTYEKYGEKMTETGVYSMTRRLRSLYELGPDRIREKNILIDKVVEG